MNPSLPCIGKIDVVRPKSVGGSSLSQETEGDLTDKPAAIKSQPQPDVVAPVEILKRIMNTSYSDSRLSIAVYCLGQTIVLSSGPDSQQGKKESKSMLLFNVERYATITLGLRWWDISQEFNWIEAWLDNLIDSAPKLAVCNIQNGLVQGYELVPSGIFDTHVVHQNSLGIISFLQSHCLQDPGVYWLYKRAGEYVIHLFDLSTISKEQSSTPTPNPSPLVVRSAAHEQLARVLLNKEAESTTVQRKINISDLEEELHVDQKSSTSTSGASSIPSQQAAVDHVYEAIKSLLSTQKLPSSEGDSKWLPTSKVEQKLWSLVLLLGEAYLSLGEAYKEDGQLEQALKTIELACYTYGSMPHSKLHVPALWNSFSQQLVFEDFFLSSDSPVTLEEEDLEAKLLACDISVRTVSSVCLFWSRAWLLVGDIYFNFLRRATPHGSELVKKAEQALNPYGVPEELVILKKKMLMAQGKKACVSCSLINCRCWQGRDKKSARGNIFKYLQRCGKYDLESYRLGALDCYNEAQRAIQVVPSKELHPLIKRRAIVWAQTAAKFLSIQQFEKADEAYGHAIQAFRQIDNHVHLVLINWNVGVERRRAATAIVDKMKTQLSEKARSQSLEAAKLGYLTSIRYLMAAANEYEVAVEAGIAFPEEMRLQVYGWLGSTHVHLAKFLSLEDTTVVAPPGLKTSSHSSSHQLSAIDFYQRALDAYSSVACEKEVATTYHMLAQHHNMCCSKLLEKRDNQTALEQALLADGYWVKSFEWFSPKNNPLTFLQILTMRAIAFHKFPKQPVSVFESQVSRFLESRHISKSDEESLPNEILTGFWSQLRSTLQAVLRAFISDAERSEESREKVKDLYFKSLKAERLSDLDAMHKCWMTLQSLPN